MVLCMVFALAAWQLQRLSSGATAQKTLKIGVFEPATGEKRRLGQQEVRGIRHAHSLKPTATINGTE